MEIKKAQFIPRGMNQDMSISKLKSEFSYENKNIRITAREANTLLSIENERGNALIAMKVEDNNGLPTATDLTIAGICIGYATINNYVIVFTTDPNNATYPDKIYRIKDLSSATVTGKLIFQGKLDFNINNPLETLPYFETDDIQKVYWVDGRNQTRVINFKADLATMNSWNNDSFNFAPTIALNETAEVSQLPSGGLFPSGVIQYGFTYFNKYSPQTTLFRVTDLYSTSPNDRTLPADAISTVSFKIQLTNLDTSFEYLRVYSIQRTSLDAEPVVKIVGDYPITKVSPSNLTIYDNGQIGSTIDFHTLLYLGGEDVIFGTITTKDNTFFGGNIKINRKTSLNESLNAIDTGTGEYIYKELIPGTTRYRLKNTTFAWKHRTSPITIEDKDTAFNSLYLYRPVSLDKPRQAMTHFKSSQHYRLGIQAQYQTGKWSEPIYLGEDKLCDKPFLTGVNNAAKNVSLYLNKGELSLPSNILKLFYDNGYRRVRPIMVATTRNDREVIAQGILNNTIAWNDQRDKNSVFAFNDYIARPNIMDIDYNEDVAFKHFPTINPASLDVNAFVNFSHQMPLLKELAPSDKTDVTLVNALPEEGDKPRAFIDQNLLTMWSPDVQYDESLADILSSNMTCQIVGLVNVAINSVNQYYNDSDGNTFIVRTKPYDSAFETDDTKTLIGGQVLSALKDVPTIGQNIFQYDSIKKSDTNDTVIPVNLVKQQYALKTYGLFNTMFDIDNPNLTLAINKPIQVNTNDTNNTVPYTTNRDDKDGSIIYGKHYDDLVFSPEAVDIQGTVYNVSKYSRMLFRSNTHLLFSLKNTQKKLGTDSFFTNITPVLPSFTFNKSTDGISEDAVLVNIQPPTVDHTTGPSHDFIYNATTTFKVKIQGIANMQVGDKIIIRVVIEFRRYEALNPVGPDFELTPLTTTDEFYIEVDGSNYVETDGYFTVNLTKNIGFGTAAGTQIGTIENDDVWFKEVIASVSPSENEINYLFTGEYVPETAAITNKLYPEAYYRTSGTQFYKEFFNTQTLIYKNGPIPNYAKPYTYFPLAEIRRSVSPDVQFGGPSNEALYDNLWIPCGDAVNIVKAGEVYSTNKVIEYTNGDTYVRRYDCLRVAPDNEQQVQMVTNAVSFLCESYLNMDGRYDRNRYNPDITYSRFTNFGLLNPVMHQRDNLFNYRILDARMFGNQSFTNQITWTLEKNNGELVDSWANITLLSTLDLDGSMGQLNALKTFNNEIVAFQDKGVARVLFNSRVMVQTSDNIPIELANNSKVSGFRYVSNQIGCSNKWSIKEAKNGVYFMDSLGKTINIYSGEKIEDISTLYGFKKWCNASINAIGGLFNPTTKIDLNNFIASYDKRNEDIYFTDKTQSLNFSEVLRSFISFYSYDNTPYMFNFQDDFLAIRNNLNGGNYTTALYKQGEGAYNQFYGTLQESYIHYLINPDPTLDKTFNNLEYRADCFNMNENPQTYLPMTSFSKIKLWNEYQNTTDINLLLGSNLFKKFKIWKTILPRQYQSLNRIRSTWVNLKLTFTPEVNKNTRLVLHDLVVKYTI